jgi:hypothetical protein
MIDLAGLLSKRRRYPESDHLFELANQKEPNSAKLFFARAAAYVKSNRDLAQAQSLLSRYMETAHTPDDAPRPHVAPLAEKLRYGKQPIRRFPRSNPPQA